jgi:hypothetical protein
MKKVFLLSVGVFAGLMAISQPQFHNIHVGGFQRSNWRIEEAGVNGSAKFGNLTCAGLAINDKAVFHLDISYFLNGIFNKENNQGGVYEFGVGTPFASKENSRWGWSFDVMSKHARTQRFRFDTTESAHYKDFYYAGVGGSIYYVRTFGDLIYIAPKLSISYGGVNFSSQRKVLSDAAISIGAPFSSGWGLSATFGIYGIEIEPIDLTVGYIRIGVAYLWKK